MPRSLHPILNRQESSTYQEPRVHRLPSANKPTEAAAYADYDVPRPHQGFNNRINQPARTLSVDSRWAALFLFSFVIYKTILGKKTIVTID